MIAAPMRAPRFAARTRFAAVSAALVVLAACDASALGGPTPAAPSPSEAATRIRTPRPTPTPAATPTYTNIPDAELMAVVPTTVAGVPVVKVDEVALTPGDVGTVYGEVGRRFRSLAIAYTEQPRLTVFAMRMDPPYANTRRLRAYLPEVGRYLGISELDPEAWSLTTIGGGEVWVRGEDAATTAGTRIYTWAAGDMVFLLIGTDEAHNVAMISALPPAEPN